MKFDFHTHHERCGHAEGTIEDYIRSAIEQRLDMIGISDHSPYFGDEEDHPHPEVAMAKSEFPNYVEEVLRLKKKYEGQIEVLLGVESDFFPEHAETYRKVYECYPFDYIIGSVHRSDHISIFNKNRWKNLTKKAQQEQKERYYALIAESAKSGMFDILGHIDAMKANYPAFSDIQTEAVDRTLQVISEYDIAIEVNTSGKTKLAGGWYPSDEILERALFYGVKVTFGSDAHVPSRVGDEWEQVRQRLREIGYKEWAYFRQRKRYLTSL
ncbi:putative histidinol-phosphatase [Insulibacter thermoxylanivorax]|uniref:Histidinol-phosphatase n=1 Tax=Insulibacter thermoxylanivorax TaxID=2749268 RepID=A0A916VI86_9BACL|nr:histidinol-phosphatase [Insulibacter thermoxylanivorax]GFR39035.1 putative histidinol-phosphatase [Insulibacter thermoxylanivorax]